VRFLSSASGRWVEVLLGGGDLSVTHPVHDGFEVGAAGEQPGGVGVAQVVDAYVEVDPGCFDGRSLPVTAVGAGLLNVGRFVGSRKC